VRSVLRFLATQKYYTHATGDQPDSWPFLQQTRSQQLGRKMSVLLRPGGDNSVRKHMLYVCVSVSMQVCIGVWPSACVWRGKQYILKVNEYVWHEREYAHKHECADMSLTDASHWGVQND